MLYCNPFKKITSYKVGKGTERMKRIKPVRHAALSLIAMLAVLWPCAARAQNPQPVAVQPMQLSAFGGLTGDYTGLLGGKNLSVTAGVDLALPPVYHVRPGLEFRGTFPMDKGTIDSQRSVLGGARVDFLLGHRFHPYGDLLLGRGQMNYNGFFYQNYQYILTTTWVYSVGAGLDYPISDHFLVKIDGQAQRWGSAPVDSGTIWAKAGTIGVVYIFNFNRHGIR
jgi:hypothetical protein